MNHILTWTSKQLKIFHDIINVLIVAYSPEYNFFSV